MKKGDTAKLDATWWKKNKSIRLRSKTFDSVMAEYIAQKKFTSRDKDNAEAFRLALNLALKAGREAKTLVGKCGRGQDETKSVLEGYVKLFKTEAKSMADAHTAAENTAKASGNVLTKIEIRIKKLGSNVPKVNKKVAELSKTIDVWLPKTGQDKAVQICRSLFDQLEKVESRLQECEAQIEKFMKSREAAVLKDGEKRAKSALKLAQQLQALNFRAQTEITGLERKIKDAAPTG